MMVAPYLHKVMDAPSFRLLEIVRKSSITQSLFLSTRYVIGINHGYCEDFDDGGQGTQPCTRLSRSEFDLRPKRVNNAVSSAPSLLFLLPPSSLLAATSPPQPCLFIVPSCAALPAICLVAHHLGFPASSFLAAVSSSTSLLAERQPLHGFRVPVKEVLLGESLFALICALLLTAIALKTYHSIYAYIL